MGFNFEVGDTVVSIPARLNQARTLPVCGHLDRCPGELAQALIRAESGIVQLALDPWKRPLTDGPWRLNDRSRARQRGARHLEASGRLTPEQGRERAKPKSRRAILIHNQLGGGVLVPAPVVVECPICGRFNRITVELLEQAVVTAALPTGSLRMRRRGGSGRRGLVQH